MKGRAYARHHNERKKTRVRRYFVCDAYDYTMVLDPRHGQRQVRVRGPYPSDDPARVGKMARTPKPCSCWACANPRKWFGIPTIQERKAPCLDEWD